VLSAAPARVKLERLDQLMIWKLDAESRFYLCFFCSKLTACLGSEKLNID
jgi:hypothetical protein